MNDGLRIGIIILSLLLFIVITYILKKGRMPIKYALVWYFADFVIFITVVFPILMTSFSRLIGFGTLANMILCILICILIFINMILTIIVSGQTTKIRLLIQEVSIIKSELEKDKK